MPGVIEFIGWALAGAGATSAVAIQLGYFLIGAAEVLGTLAVVAGAYAMSERAKRKARAAYNAAQVDRLTNVGTTAYPRELVLGRVRKGGSVFFRGSVGQHKEKFYMLVALAAHEIDGVEAFYLNDTEVAVTAEGWVTTAPYARESQESAVTLLNTDGLTLPYGVVGDPYNAVGLPIGGGGGETEPTAFFRTYKILRSYARLRVYTGQPGQAADAQLIAEFPQLWNSSHKASGVAYLICEFLYDETAFPSGIPAATVKLRGAKCYDPRNGQTVWTNNPALHARHIMLHPQFGKRTSMTAAEDARIVAAANACDTAHNYVAQAPAGSALTGWSFVVARLLVLQLIGTRALFRSDIVIPFGTTAADALDDVTQAMAGHWAYAGGELHIKAGVYTSPVKAFTENDLAVVAHDSESGTSQSPISIVTHRARADKFNTVNARIWDAGQEYKQTPLSPLKSDALIARDGAVLPVEVDMPAVSSSLQALLVAGIMMRDARDPLTVNVTLKLSAYNLELFDNITLTVARYGWTNKPFMVLSRTWSPQGMVALTLKETAPEIYQPDAAFDVDGYGDNTALARPWDITPPTGLAATSGTAELIVAPDGTVQSRAKVSWTAVEDASIRVGGAVELRWTYQASDPPVWQTVSANGADTTVHIGNLIDGRVIFVQARTRNTVAVSSWSAVLQHTVVGKTEPPSNVTSVFTEYGQEVLALRWLPIADFDVAGYEVRTANTNWGLAGEVFRGNSLSCPINPTAGTWYVKAYDTTGNYSATAASASFSSAQVPNVTGLTHLYADTSLTAATVTLSWVDAAPQFGLDSYKLTYGSEALTVRANTITLPANWIGNRTFTIKTVDRFGVESTGASFAVTKLAPAPALNFRAQVIDNNVLLFWTLPAKTSLPISHILLKKGATWAGADSIGTKDGEFTTISELAGGNYTYWLAVVDTDGYESTPVSLTTSVSQPPDFIFNAEYSSTFGGTLSNAKLSGGGVVLPVNLTETVSQHFDNNSWTSPQAQVTAGYPVFIQPGVSTGYYEETFDYGTLLASSSVTVTQDGVTLSGVVSISVNISISADGSSWTDYVGLTNLFALNFRYVKVRVAVTQVSGGGVYQLNQLTARLDSKLKTDAGVVSALSTDASGTIVNLNTEFVDLVSITPAISGTTSRTAVYDFLDTVQSGTYTLTSNVATLTVTGHGLLVGQKVRIMPTSGTLTLGVYVVASVVNANSYTVAAVAANSSGNLTTYPNSFRVYVFDSAGARQSATVSWTVRGS